MNSRVHPKYKTKYRVGNWREYERALVRRGDVTFWLSADAIDAWTPAPSGRRGAQRKFSDRAIETALTLQLVFGLPLRQAEGFLRSVLSLMRVDLDAPDHTTLSRRSQHLEVKFHRVPATGPIHLIVDATGLSIFGEGEWAAVKLWRTRPAGLEETSSGRRWIGDDRRAHADRWQGRSRTDRSGTDRDRRRHNLMRHGRWCLRHGRDLRGGRCAWRHGRRSTDDHAGRVAPETTVEPSRLHDPESETDRPPPMEEGIRLPSTGAGGERLLPVQVDHW